MILKNEQDLLAKKTRKGEILRVKTAGEEGLRGRETLRFVTGQGGAVSREWVWLALKVCIQEVAGKD